MKFLFLVRKCHSKYQIKDTIRENTLQDMNVYLLDVLKLCDSVNKLCCWRIKYFIIDIHHNKIVTPLLFVIYKYNSQHNNFYNKTKYVIGIFENLQVLNTSIYNREQYRYSCCAHSWLYLHWSFKYSVDIL